LSIAVRLRLFLLHFILSVFYEQINNDDDELVTISGEVYNLVSADNVVPYHMFDQFLLLSEAVNGPKNLALVFGLCS